MDCAQNLIFNLKKKKRNPTKKPLTFSIISQTDKFQAVHGIVKCFLFLVKTLLSDSLVFLCPYTLLCSARAISPSIPVNMQCSRCNSAAAIYIGGLSGWQKPARPLGVFFSVSAAQRRAPPLFLPPFEHLRSEHFLTSNNGRKQRQTLYIKNTRVQLFCIASFG